MEEIEKDYTLEELKTSANASIFSDEVLSKLEQAFENDFTNEEAARFAGISPATYYNWYKISSQFRENVDRSKDFAFIAAKKLIAASIKSGVVEDAWKLLKTRQKSLYSTRNELTDGEGKPLETGAGDLKVIAAGISKLLTDEPTTSETSSERNS